MPLTQNVDFFIFAKGSLFCGPNFAAPSPAPSPLQAPPAPAPAPAPARVPPPLPTVDGSTGAQLDVISRLLKDRILLLGQGVDDEVSNMLVAQLLYLANEDPEKDITLYINSPGGECLVPVLRVTIDTTLRQIPILFLQNKLQPNNPNPTLTLINNAKCCFSLLSSGSVSAGLAIYDTMQFVPCDVQTVSFGMAASMGAFLLGAGAKGKRKSLPNARIMIHQPLGGAQGQASDIEIQAKEILYTKDLLNTYIAQYTDQPKSKIEEDCDRDFFMTPYEAVEYGIIDEVIQTKTSNIKLPQMPSLY